MAMDRLPFAFVAMIARPLSMALSQREILQRSLIWIAAVAVIGGTVWLAAERFNEQLVKTRTDAHVKEIISVLDLESMPEFHQRSDKVRTFINDNSIHKIDRAFWANHANPSSFAAGLLAHAKGVAEPVHMECSTRTNLLGLVLQALGYQTRVVTIFSTRSNLNSHSFIEVMNPETKRWETQDADYDIFWRSKDTAERISVGEMAEAIDDIEPCGRGGCGWDHKSREGIRAAKLKPYLDIISITPEHKAARYALYTSRADLSRTYSKGLKQGTFCEVEAKRCKMGFYDITKYSTYAPGLPRRSSEATTIARSKISVCGLPALA